MILFVCFVTFILRRHTLTAEAVFVTMALFNTLRNTMTLYFPHAISLGAELMISSKRIQVNIISVHIKEQRIEIWLKFQTFLELEEIEQKSVEYSERKESSVEVIVNAINAKWNDVSLDFTVP
jgi:ATP-binding cassette subfamily C (CFTR/MRP) protein 4